MCLLCFCTRNTNPLWLSGLYGILTGLLFFKQRWLLSYSLPFAFMSFSLSAVHSSLFLGLVVWRSSTHEQLDLWPWRDLSPLLPNHAHRWDVHFWFSLKEALMRPCLCCCLYVCMCACVLLCQSHFLQVCSSPKGTSLFVRPNILCFK